jgi:hypothetical protein
MGIFTFDEQPELASTIKAELQRRGLEPDTDTEWEVHGPHGRDFPDPVYIGSARRKSEESTRLLVVIYPRAVYEIEDGNPSHWSDTHHLRRIPVHR